MDLTREISRRLKLSLHLTHLKLTDETGRHLTHSLYQGGIHLKAVIVSPDFEGLKLLERHQLVYRALGSLIKGEIQALSLKTHTPGEWDKDQSESE